MIFKYALIVTAHKWKAIWWRHKRSKQQHHRYRITHLFLVHDVYSAHMKMRIYIIWWCCHHIIHWFRFYNHAPTTSHPSPLSHNSQRSSKILYWRHDNYMWPIISNCPLGPNSAIASHARLFFLINFRSLEAQKVFKL